MIGNTAHIRGVTGRITVNSTTWTAARVDSTNLDGRQWLLIQNRTGARLAFTTDNTKVYKECPEIGIGQIVELPVSDSITIYVKCRSGAVRHCTIMELA